MQADLKGEFIKFLFKTLVDLWVRKDFIEIQEGRIPRNLAIEAKLDRRGREQKFKD